MNRPPGQGYPYDQPHPTPAEYGVPAPFDRILCGYPIVPTDQPNGPILCANTAPCPIHRDKRVNHERDAVEAQLNAAVSEGDGSFDDVAATGSDAAYVALADPVKGLHEAISGEPSPGFAELRERYGDPADLKPIPHYDPGSPVDLHDQLHADDQPWSVKSRLATSLGRRALATRLADALPPLLGAELADRLDTLITQAVTETEARITQDLSDEYHAARARLDADAAKKLKEVHDERYKRPSRLS